ncbi:hypothetical protein LP032_073 [Listeria phage LP-032]|uniref:Uncharacterized protein n=8 Tax=Homburgvirus TaxID=1921125 RepID=A0A5A4K6S8_9CAUD|nr:hypothetical protein P70_00116 [Listeria phage P70]YP_008240421.1 hypothetical protein LP110_057 [Listeria phage LP-110]YP_009044174.1 hypothetical protein LP026_089 [Listeria phage LP-026]YP_009045148.1 hypothetical protein LP114_094 [Listeria phage LP-114]AHL18922.1 hypothetical protein LP032_073 [Listeria phage LP-032]AWY07750.1 hypothetical protein [Listeria phage LP-KV022]QDK04613.1 hypothetical protein FK481_0099 [Listeria phage LP-010]QDK04724.1 hypothetical protein FK482_0102 [Lis
METNLPSLSSALLHDLACSRQYDLRYVDVVNVTITMCEDTPTSKEFFSIELETKYNRNIWKFGEGRYTVVLGETTWK